MSSREGEIIDRDINNALELLVLVTTMEDKIAALNYHGNVV
ncbi:hypothetical protein [Photobacterium kishitanii]|nr:hypothetical protein [Photobacterium kishitanii]CEO37900.1 hypothetical protein PPBDW_I10251 [Photobacterium kishitanii]